LQLGNGITNGSILGDVAADAGATLAFDPAAVTQIPFSGAISGEGALLR
jgi:hypothetical protein